MKTLRIAALCVLLTGGASGGPLPAQEEPGQGEERTVEQELSDINRSLQQIAGLLKRQVEKQDTDLLMMRIIYKSQRLQPLEADLRSKREYRDGLEESIKQVDENLADMETRAKDEGEGLSEADLRERRADMARYQKQMQEQIGKLDLKIVELENEIAATKREVQAFEDALDERLRGK